MNSQKSFQLELPVSGFECRRLGMLHFDAFAAVLITKYLKSLETVNIVPLWISVYADQV